MGSAISCLGDSCSGHGCFPPRPGINASSKLFVQGRPAHRVGDSWQLHTCGNDTHDATVVYGSYKMFESGQSVAVIGSVLSCGSILAAGSSKFFVGLA